MNLEFPSVVENFSTFCYLRIDNVFQRQLHTKNHKKKHASFLIYKQSSFRLMYPIIEKCKGDTLVC